MRRLLVVRLFREDAGFFLALVELLFRRAVVPPREVGAFFFVSAERDFAAGFFLVVGFFFVINVASFVYKCKQSFDYSTTMQTH